MYFAGLKAYVFEFDLHEDADWGPFGQGGDHDSCTVGCSTVACPVGAPSRGPRFTKQDLSHDHC